MKKLLGLVLLMLILISATEFTSPKPQPTKSIEGTWELQSFYSYDGQDISDTIEKSDGYRQVKMYSKGKIMWTRYVPDEPHGRFGYGSYKITKDSLIEVIEYGDDAMMKALDTMRNFTFELKLEKDFFSQITVDDEGNRTSSENYKRID
ncbi:hypothetical protein LV716_14230 [Flagellimonas sp. HMM57]|uniref:hypothetical protein n=1 Tax=unclassified Flagellimonas TaxID=2644544 RepID=UPI0013D43746|nr:MULTISPECIES: hypothetical protein [unclassified Flagellimonas]MBS9464186.1 hypothetical protein [Flagellimonas sp. 389]UII75406.1 hypothetical protein LV716_14230 [Flagellimonas sp. HMM57]